MEHSRNIKSEKKFQPVSRSLEKKTIQNKTTALQDNRPSSVLQKKANNTGLPDDLKSGIENLSGHAMDDVKVHYNSNKPAELNAHAYAQGSEIHLASGQEKHLPHEAWHVAQQKQGRVKPTLQMKGKVNVNDDTGLEKEADVMGEKALQRVQSNIIEKRHPQKSKNTIVQRVELKLSNKGEEWVVDSSEKELLKNWIDHQQEIDNFQAVVALVNQLGVIPKPSQEEGFIYLYAKLKAYEINSEVQDKIARVRKDANPENITNISKFIKAQAEYQNIMNGYYSKEDIMKNHQSIGLEFEFANYTNDEEVPSHIDLSQTGSYSALFNLPFVLETDSGKELEIGFPPFLVFIDGHEKSKIQDIWLTMRKEMSEIREASKGQDLNFLLAKIAQSGLGWGWSSINRKHADMRVADARTKHNGTNEDNVYSQLNISMDGAESAKHLKELAKKGMSTQNERELIIPIYQELERMFSTESEKQNITGMSEEIFTHLLKSSTSIMAIPSILIQDSPLLRDAGMTSGLFDLQSTVKELHGIWIKDSLPNILRTINPKSLSVAASLLERVKDELISFATRTIVDLLNANFDSGQKVANTYFKQEIDPVAKAIDVPFKTANDWYGSENWTAHGRLQAELGLAVTTLESLIAKDKTGFLIGFKDGVKTLETLHQEMPLYIQDTTGATAHYKSAGITYLTSANWVEPNGQIEKLQGVFNVVNKFNPKKKLAELFIRMIQEEIDGTIRILEESVDYVKTPKTGFNKGEKFGSGHGVRKDTHIPTVKTGKATAKNVAELRGDQVLKHYLE